MPIYEFGCRRCGNQFEELLLANEDIGDVRCPDCRSKRIKRRASAFFARSSSSGNGGGKSLGGSSCASCASGSCSGCRH